MTDLSAIRTKRSNMLELVTILHNLVVLLKNDDDKAFAHEGTLAGEKLEQIVADIESTDDEAEVDAHLASMERLRVHLLATCHRYLEVHEG